MHLIIGKGSKSGRKKARHDDQCSTFDKRYIYVKGKEIPPAYERQSSEMASPKFDAQLACFDIDPYLPKHIKEENELENSPCNYQSVYSLHY